MPKFSLILCTIGRTEQLQLFLEYLVKQTYKEFELIVVDQNPDIRLIPILKPYRKLFPIIRLRSNPGLSRSRNVGLRFINGDIVAFPDDDCCYPIDLLERVQNFLKKHPNWDGITGYPTGEFGESYKNIPSSEISRFNVWKRGISCTIFLRSSIVKKVGWFDETLGVGSGTNWWAGEEMDYMIRALKAGFYLQYEPSLVIIHPSIPVEGNKDFNWVLNKAYHYAMGDGRLLAKHNYPIWFVFWQLLRPLGGILFFLLIGQMEKSRVRMAYVPGKLKGWLDRPAS